MTIENCKFRFQWHCFKVDCIPTALTAGGGGKEKVNLLCGVLSCLTLLGFSEVPVEMAFGPPVFLSHLFRMSLSRKAKMMTSSKLMPETRHVSV